jgi:hypothetical protein
LAEEVYPQTKEDIANGVIKWSDRKAETFDSKEIFSMIDRMVIEGLLTPVFDGFEPSVKKSLKAVKIHD